MSDSVGEAQLPRLTQTREHAARRIAERIHEFEDIQRKLRKPVKIRDLEDDTENKRRYTIDLLRSLFDGPQPADEFDQQTRISVFYTNPSDDERRHKLEEHLRQCINHLRSLTSRIDFYYPMDKEKPTGKEKGHADQPTLAILLFFFLLIAAAGLILWQQDRITRVHGAAGVLLYLVSSLVPAILLFGLYRTVAKASGTLYGLSIELSGPAALFIIVLLILLRLSSAGAEQRPAGTDTSPTITTDVLLSTDTAKTTTITSPPTQTMTTSIPPIAEWIQLGDYDQTTGRWTTAKLDFLTSTPPNDLRCKDVTVTGEAGRLTIRTQPGNQGGQISGAIETGDTVTILDVVPGTDRRAQWARIRKQSTTQPPTGEDIKFDAIPTATIPGYFVSAIAYLHDRQISVTGVTPPESVLVVANTLAFYGGHAVRSENVLTQLETKQRPASFTLTFSQPLARISITRAGLFPTTESGVSHPAWIATALDAAGHVVSTTGEPLLMEHCDVPAQTYTLVTKGTPILSVQFDSDLRKNGKPHAGFLALLIERLTIASWPARRAR